MGLFIEVDANGGGRYPDRVKPPPEGKKKTRMARTASLEPAY